LAVWAIPQDFPHRSRHNGGPIRAIASVIFSWKTALSNPAALVSKPTNGGVIRSGRLAVANGSIKAQGENVAEYDCLDWPRFTHFSVARSNAMEAICKWQKGGTFGNHAEVVPREGARQNPSHKQAARQPERNVHRRESLNEVFTPLARGALHWLQQLLVNLCPPAILRA